MLTMPMIPPQLSLPVLGVPVFAYDMPKDKAGLQGGYRQVHVREMNNARESKKM